MAFQHQGIDILLLRERAKGDGSGDIRRAVEILGSAVEQQHSLRLQGDVRLGRGLIMHDGSMGAIAGIDERGNTNSNVMTATAASAMAAHIMVNLRLEPRGFCFSDG